MSRFLSSNFMVSEDMIEAGGYKTFKIDFLNDFFFVNSTKGTRIFILLISCSKLKGTSFFYVSFTSGVETFLGC